MLDSAIRYWGPGSKFADKGGAAAYRFEDSLDRWLRKELDALYREVLDEALPDELADLVRQYQARLEEDPNNGRNTA